MLQSHYDNMEDTMKDRAKTFMYISIGIMALAVAFQMGAQSVNAQGGDVVSISARDGCNVMAMTASGDAYYSSDCGATWTDLPPSI